MEETINMRQYEAIENYLKKYENAEKSLRKYKSELEQLRNSYDQIKSTSDNDGMPHGTAIGSPTENKAIKVADKILEYTDKLFETQEVKLEIFEAIIKLSGMEQDVLYDRYILLMQWDKICEKHHYSWSGIHKIHRTALGKVEKIIDTKSE